MKKRSWIMLCLVYLVINLGDLSVALPRFALQKGMKCISCHINPTGGVMRNSYGSMMFSRGELPVPAHESGDFDPNVTDQLILGADIRTQFLYDGNVKETSFQAMQGALYLAALLNSHTTLFTKFDIRNKEFEAYALLGFWSNKFILKAGSFLPAYGIRVDDHTVYTRGGNLGWLRGTTTRGLIFYPNYREVGVEGTAYIGKSITLNLGVTNGFSFSGSGFSYETIHFSKKKAIIGRAEYFSKIGSVNYFVGGSVYTGLDSVNMAGGFFGLNWGRFTVFGEVDQAKKIPGIYGPFRISRADVNLVEVDYLVTQGIYAIVRYDTYDDTTVQPLTRITVGAEYFPYSFVEIRPQYRMNSESPKVSNDEVVVQLHLWF